MTLEPETLRIAEEEIEERIDKLLTRHFPQCSRTYFQYLIEEGSVLLNGEPVKKRTRPKVGDEIEICFILTPELSLLPEPIPLEILYEDEYLLAINKPSGMVVHPAPGHYSGTFVNALLHHCKEIETQDNLRPGIVHRLDKETTGVLLAAKTVAAHKALISLFSQRLIEKHYLAICLGKPGEGTIHAPIKRHPKRRKEMAVCFEGGREAISEYRTLSSNASFSLVKIKLITGRTHQIRVHMKHNNSPVLGDPLYGAPSLNQKFAMPRQLLHAHTVRFSHPIHGKEVFITAPLPQDMQLFINKHFNLTVD